jgi:hypothetical protein
MFIWSIAIELDLGPDLCFCFLFVSLLSLPLILILTLSCYSVIAIAFWLVVCHHFDSDSPTQLLEASIQTSFEINSASLVDTQFSSALLRQLGLPFTPYESSAAAAEISHDLFAPRRANLMLVVDGVTSQELNLRNVEISASKVVRSSSSPAASSASLLASMLTGATPREHGIVADKWEYLGETEHAYIHAFPDRASVADILAQYTFGSAQIVSASASPMFARALGLRPTLSAYSTHASTVQFNVFNSRVEQISGHLSSSVAHLSSENLISIIHTHFRDETLLETPEHQALYAELAMILKSVSELSLRAQVATVPDMYSFAITALNPIRAIHGTAASEYTSALSLVRKTIVRAIEKVQHAYEDKAIYEVLCIRMTPVKTTEQAVVTVYRVSDILGLSFEQTSAFWPHINTELINPCSELHAAGIEAYCPFTRDDRVMQQQSNALYAEQTGSDAFTRAVIDGSTADETVAQWLMFMFTWILLAVITYIIWYAFYSMDIGEDSLLYRMTAIPQQRVERN